jgi:hypothetical protein
MPISMDDEGSAATATRYLAARGHRRIGFIAGAPEYNLSGWRIDGWRPCGAPKKAPCAARARGLITQGKKKPPRLCGPRRRVAPGGNVQKRPLQTQGWPLRLSI